MAGLKITGRGVGLLIALCVSVLIVSLPPAGLAQETGGVVVFSKLIKGDVPAEDPTSPVWDTVPDVQFPMSAQVHWEPRIFSVTVHSVQVKSVQNGKEMAILLIYKDPTDDPGDAAALEFMVGPKKAHFAHGQLMAQVEGGPVNIWYWKNSTQSVNDMWAKGFGTLRPQNHQDVKGKGAYKDGEWRVVFSRPLMDDDKEDAQFPLGKFQNIAFAIWDGANNEKGAQKAVTSWWYFRPEPRPDFTIYIYTGVVVLVVGGVEMVIVRRLRRKGKGA